MTGLNSLGSTVTLLTDTARRLTPMAENCFTILAVEWMAAAQGLEFHAPSKTSTQLAAAHALLREHVESVQTDRFFAPDMETAKRLLVDGALSGIVGDEVGVSYGAG